MKSSSLCFPSNLSSEGGLCFLHHLQGLVFPISHALATHSLFPLRIIYDPHIIHMYQLTLGIIVVSLALERWLKLQTYSSYMVCFEYHELSSHVQQYTLALIRHLSTCTTWPWLGLAKPKVLADQKFQSTFVTLALIRHSSFSICLFLSS